MGLKIINDTSIPVAVDSSVYFDDKHLADDFCKVLSPGESVVLRDEALTDENRSDVCLINASDGSFKDREGAFNIEETKQTLRELRPPLREIRVIPEKHLEARLRQAAAGAQTKDILTVSEYETVKAATEQIAPPALAGACLAEIEVLLAKNAEETSGLFSAQQRLLDFARRLPPAEEEKGAELK